MLNSLILFLFISINFFIIKNFSKLKILHINLDIPDNLRKIHSKPTPLAGGIIIFFNIFLYHLIVLSLPNLFLSDKEFFKDINEVNIFFFSTTAIFIIGFLDDKINLKATLKFFLSLIIIFFLIKADNGLLITNIQLSFYPNNIALGPYSLFFTIFCFLVFINAFNMFDGINLQSSFYSLIIFLGISFLYINLFFVNMLIIVLIFFSYLNFINKSFLGDSGTLLLSFIISYIFIKSYNQDLIKYADQIVLFMIIPGLDLMRLFILRIFNKKSPLSADRKHLHHILIEKYSLTKTLAIIIILILMPLILSFFHIGFLTIITVIIIAYSIIVIKSYFKD